ncbi:DEAD/DEAH box helicase [Haloarcula japonica]|uniref:ATP-dependent helicase/DEAD/H associated domain-containing protein n=1 Tax=Haloarcula japonica (strain ATCC 49778 / DSM 6131 / JCM 7785 / NBRC 101032 / NCIMB 13157 / TR-1) TaxID=1227453 RepID=M0LC30_HALJT|nr:DEAD/DEAH box helicase [Haloarcula japonica]EMA30683.1 ATP-dependent helicase/DEAD/H associated domain-containing protein [Haloarcula japonica DSM 6131]
MTDGVARGDDAFTALGPAVRSALSERGFTTPTDPQRKAIPTLAAGRDTLVVAPTGTGKTETAMLPVFDALAESEDRFGIGALYITPLRALNRDMRQRLDWWGETLGLEVDVRHGDTTDYQRQKQADDPPDVLVTTPETLQAMLTGSKLRTALEDVEHIVIDEVHELAAAKRGAQLTVGLERLRELSGRFQRIGLSATVGDPHEVGRFLTGGRSCAIVEVDIGSRLDIEVVRPQITDRDEELSSTLVTDAGTASHVRYIADLIDDHESVLLFVNTRQTAEALGSRFKELGTDLGVHHGSLSKEARIDVEDRFKAGDLDALLCTSSMELGIDVGHVDHVVQYGSPRQVSRLVQRVGRAGHRRDLVSSGTVVTTDTDDTLEALAIARQAEAGDVEPAEIHDGSLDTVANQIAGLVMDTGEIRAMRAFEILTRAYPFRDLDESQFKQVIEELAANNVIWLDEDRDTLEKRRGTWQYFYQNLSMIPDEATYDVEDVASGQQVGTLDEKFVVNFATPGEVFVQRGEMWRITNIDEEEEVVTVSPIEDPAGEVPSWVGQEIPVPRAVAAEVGELRRVAGRQLQDGADTDAVAKDVATRYAAGPETVADGLSQVEKHEGPIPDDTTVVVEFHGREVIVNACYGHKINETLGRVLSALLGQRAGSSVAMDVDPYRITLEVPRRITAGDVIEVIEDTDPDHLPALVELSLKNADALKFKLAQVATKFGSLKRWRGRGSTDFGRDRLLAALEDTPMYDEALREVRHEDLAIEATAALLRDIQSGDVALETVGEHTAIGTGGSSSGRELLSPENADASVIKTVKERIQSDRVILMCLHCKDWDRKQQVKRVRDQPSCPQCGSTRIAALNPWAEEVVSAVRTDDKDEEQEKMTERAYRSGSLVQSHGKRAVIALAARGVGPHNAARIINRLREDEDEFYRDILRQEREYARTQSFWG